MNTDLLPSHVEQNNCGGLLATKCDEEEDSTDERRPSIAYIKEEEEPEDVYSCDSIYRPSTYEEDSPSDEVSCAFNK
jgi:hypothetical protein